MISFVVIAYDMQREVPRTLRSLARTYQQDCADIDYEVIVVDNGSPEPLVLDDETTRDVPVRLLRRENVSVSPADAVNFGVARAGGDWVAVMIDGARMLSPGVVRGIADARRLADEPVIAVLGLHLGPFLQRESQQRGYSRAVEDKLLAAVDWPRNGYGLFQISCWSASTPRGWFGPVAESNCIAVRRSFFLELGGYDEAFVSRGGGLVNLDFYKRAVEYASSRLIYLLGEGCFHQLHNGVTTGQGTRFDALNEEYRSLRGEGFVVPQEPALLFGHLSELHGPVLVDPVGNIMASPSVQTVAERCAPFLE